MNDRDSVANTKPRIYSRDQHNISRKNIDQDALKIMHRLNRYGYKAYLVGGGVRDLLLEKSPKDFDIATNATPRQIKSLFRNSRIIGRRFKLIHVFFRGGKIIEVSTFRDYDDEDDSQSEGELIKRDNTYGNECTDAFRRDLTINGLFYSSDNFTIVDYVGGVEDLEQKVTKMIGDPDVRLPEDPVRLMRVVRHAVKAGFSIQTKLKKSLIKHSHLIAQCPAMRVYEELRKDFSSGHSLEILRGLQEYSILNFLLPELTVNEKLLSTNSCLANALTAIDQISASGQHEISTTAFLSVLTLLHTLDPKTDHGSLEIFPTRDEIIELSKSSFKNLAIPRKERERIEKTILLWKGVCESPLDKLKAETLASRAAITDVASIAAAFYQDEDPELFSLLSLAVQKRKQRSRGRSNFNSGDQTSSPRPKQKRRKNSYNRNSRRGGRGKR